MLVAPGGHYQKMRESQMPALDGAAAQHLVRGAEYEWVDDSPGIVHHRTPTGEVLFEDQTVDANDDNGEEDWVVGQETVG